MRLLRVPVAAVLVVGALASVRAARQAPASEVLQDPMASYDTFVKLSADDRLMHWNRTTPEIRSQLAQAHANAWLQVNQPRLSQAEIADVKSLVALLTPAFYATPETEASKARSDEFDRKVFCTLWKSDIVQAFRPLGRPPADISWSDDVLGWLGKCYFGA